jgi:hypothetical protein
MAAIALIETCTERDRAAARNGIAHLDLWPSQGFPMTIQKSTAAAMNDIGHLPGWVRHYSLSSVGWFSLWKPRIVI